MGFPAQVSGSFQSVSTLNLTSSFDNTATHDESEVPGGFMSVMCFLCYLH